MRQTITARLFTEFHVWEVGTDRLSHAHFRDRFGNIATQSACKAEGRGKKVYKTVVACPDCYRILRKEYEPGSVEVG